MNYRSGFLVALLVVLHMLPPVVAARQSVASATTEQLWDAGWATVDIACELKCSQRRVQQILAAGGAVGGRGCCRLPVHPDLPAVVLYEMTRHGANYGCKMLLGALHHHHPGWSFPRRAVYAVLRAADPAAHEARRRWASRRLLRGVYFAPHFQYSVHIDLAW